MLTVFICEVTAFLTNSYTTLLSLDSHEADSLQINFDIDIHDIECRNLHVVVFAQSSQESLKMMTKDFWLRSLDSNGRPFGVAAKPTDNEEDVVHKAKMAQLASTDGQSELDSNWLNSHDGFNHNNFDHVIQAHDFTLINFFAGWCGHCQVFAPTWDKIAGEINGGERNKAKVYTDKQGQMRSVRVIKMNCVDFQDVCLNIGIDAFPTVRLYKGDGTFSLFEGARNEEEIHRWVEKMIRLSKYGWSADHESFERGCNARGRLQVPRVPGHLELRAGAGDQDLVVDLTNVSHLVKHLSFSDPGDGYFHRKAWLGLPNHVLENLNPLDAKNYISETFHKVWIHDMKVVSTTAPGGSVVYQFVHQHRLSSLPDTTIPQVQFHYDIEPFSVQVKRQNKPWYNFCTSVLAIMGGTFVFMRLVTMSLLGVKSAIFPKSRKSRTGLDY